MRYLKRESKAHYGRWPALCALLLVALVAAASLLGPARPPQAARAATSFSFTAAGDYGKTKNTTATLKAIAASGTLFNLALGDLNYDYPTLSAAAWSAYVRSSLPTSVPFEVLVGEHDTGDLPALVADLPDGLGSSGSYGEEYYFDYPPATPLARFILVSPGPMVPSLDYKKGGADYTWVSNTIDAARAAGIPWVIVAMHRYCLRIPSSAQDPCTAPALMNLLISKRVDLVLTGQKHGYQASKQLAFGSGCSSIQLGGYNPACVASAATSLVKGQGSVFVITGTGGKSLASLDTTNAETGYFRAWEGAGISPTWGFSRFTVSAGQLSMSFQPSAGAGFTDAFTITAGP